MQLRYPIVLICVLAAASATYFLHRTRDVARSEWTLPRAAASAEKIPNATVKQILARENENQPSARRVTTAAELTPLPPPDTPLAQIFDELKSRSEAGDAEAASRLYRDLMRCKYSPQWTAADRITVANVLARKPEHTTDEMLARAKIRLHQADQLATLCAGLDPAVFSQSTPIALHAAQLGDAAARDCYVNRGPDIDFTSLLDNPQYLTTYAREAPALIDSALANGDWKMVDMLQYAYNSRGGNMISGLVGFNPVEHYRYLRLFSLGADSQNSTVFAGWLDTRLELAAQALSPEQKANADARAQREYAQNFHGSSTEAAPHGWNACSLPTE